MAQASTIALLQPPPSRCLASYADSDWVLKQKLREEHGLKLNRHQRKNKFKLVNTDVVYHCDDGITSSKYPAKTQNNAASKAIIASGTGPDGRAEERKLRKRRRMIARSVAVVLLSVFAAMAKTYFSSSSSIAERKEMPQISGAKNVSIKESKLTGPKIPEDTDQTCQMETCSNEKRSSSISSEEQSVSGHVAENSEKAQNLSGEEDDNEVSLCANDEVSCFFVHQV